MVLTGTDAQAVRPYKGLHVRCVRCVVRCIKGYSIVVLTGTDALPLNTLRASLQRVTREVCPLCRPLYQRLQHRGFNGDGRTDRASLQRVTREVCPLCRPLYQRLQHRGFNGNGRTDRASLQRVTREVCPLYRPLYQRLQHRGFNGDGRPPTKHSPCVPTAGCTSSCYTLECYLEPVAADL